MTGNYDRNLCVDCKACTKFLNDICINFIVYSVEGLIEVNTVSASSDKKK